MLEIVSGRANATIVDAPIDITKIDAAYPDQFRYLPSRTERLADTNCVGSLIVDKNATELAEGMSAYIKELKESGGLQELYELHIKAVLAAAE
jgi:ABC-type amino acid transport substrate-binding protein